MDLEKTQKSVKTRTRTHTHWLHRNVALKITMRTHIEHRSTDKERVLRPQHRRATIVSPGRASESPK